MIPLIIARSPAHTCNAANYRCLGADALMKVLLYNTSRDFTTICKGRSGGTLAIATLSGRSSALPCSELQSALTGLASLTSLIRRTQGQLLCLHPRPTNHQFNARPTSSIQQPNPICTHHLHKNLPDILPTLRTRLQEQQPFLLCIPLRQVGRRPASVGEIGFVPDEDDDDPGVGGALEGLDPGLGSFEGGLEEGRKEGISRVRRWQGKRGGGLTSGGYGAGREGARVSVTTLMS